MTCAHTTCIFVSVQVHTYNSGTVFLTHAEPYMALVRHDDVVYALDATQRVVRMNVTVEPRAAAAVVLDGRVRTESA